MTLRIQRQVESDLVVFKLAGRIQAADVPELLALLRSESPGGGGVLFDMTDVRLVDRDAVLFLALSETVGARLRNCSAYIRQWINQERNVIRQNETKGPNGLAE